MHIDATLRAIEPCPQNIPITEQPNTLLLPDTEQGRAAAAAIDRLTAARSIDYTAIELGALARARLDVLRGHARNGRRRSRQCRGSRARNFTRAKDRATSVWYKAAVTIDALRSGAYSAAYAKGAV